LEVNVALWSVKSILEKIPFDYPVTEDALHIDFSQLAVPYFIKNTFKVSLFFKDNTFPVDASCSIYSPKNVVTVVLVIKRKYEDSLKSWLATKEDEFLVDSCRRRELYCHEISHLIAIIRAYPSNRSSKVREDFIEKLQNKFSKSIAMAQTSKAIPLISVENPGESPSSFDKEHFRYEDDSLNFFKLYQELMFPYDRMEETMATLIEKHKMTNSITFNDVAKAALVPKNFFDVFPEKLVEYQDFLAKNLFDN